MTERREENESLMGGTKSRKRWKWEEGNKAVQCRASFPMYGVHGERSSYFIALIKTGLFLLYSLEFATCQA